MRIKENVIRPNFMVPRLRDRELRQKKKQQFLA